MMLVLFIKTLILQGEKIMSKSVRQVVGVWPIIAVLVVILSGPTGVLAQQKSGTLAQQLQGSWVFVSEYSEQGGKKTEMFDSNPRGSMILSPDGRFSIMLMRASLPKFAVNSRMKGTDDENRAIVQGSVAYFGRYTVESEQEQTVNLNLHIDGSTFPNWDGQDQKRVMTIDGDKLMVTTHFDDGRTAHIVWKRGSNN
jgi:hypothetical protein